MEKENPKKIPSGGSYFRIDPTTDHLKQKDVPTDKDSPDISVLDEASLVINGPRQDDYGDVLTSFQQIADYWTTYVKRAMYAIRDDSPFELTPTDVANMMILLKVSRAQKKGDRDSYVDIAGYAGCVEKLGGIS